MRQIIFFWTVLLTTLTLCQGQTTSESTTFKKEIPTLKNGTPELGYRLCQQKVKQLILDTLQSGYDSLQIRIWYTYSKSPHCKLLIIKRTKSAWSATAYTLSTSWDIHTFTVTVTSDTAAIVNPKHGWDNFLKNLFASQIISLPDMRDIPIHDKVFDGKGYEIELATKNQYRFYSYQSPEYFQDRYWQAKNIMNITKLIETEFGIKYDL